MNNLALKSTEMKSADAWIGALGQQTFSWKNFQFVYRTIDDVYMPPYKGSTFRGAFGHALKHIHCNHQHCTGCAEKLNCPYLYIFETPQALAPDMDYHADHVPHPFVIEPPESRQTHYAPDQSIVFDLVLFGEAISELQAFIDGFREAGERGFGHTRARCQLVHVYQYDNLLKTQRTEIYNAHAAVSNPTIQSWEFSDLLDVCRQFTTSCIKINFETPVRIAKDHKLQSSLPFELFIRTALRRISMLGQAHGKAVWRLPFRDILADAGLIQIQNSNLRWYDWERHSARQQTRMKLGGLSGYVIYHGDVQPFMPIILLGSFTHVGKNTAFGLGKYDVSIQPLG